MRRNWNSVLSMGYGLAQKNVRDSRARAVCIKKLGLSKDLVLHLVGVNYPCDDPTGQTPDYRGGESHSVVTLGEAIADLNESDLEFVQNWGDFVSALREFHESDYGCLRLVLSDEKYEEHKLNEFHREMEPFAAEIARKHRVSASSLDFVKAIQDEIEAIQCNQETFNGYECRAEHYAMCVSAGARDSYWGDRDYTNGEYHSRIDKLEKLLDWLRQTCPLLMARYENELLECE